MAANEFCHNCEFTLSKHEQVIWQDIMTDEYRCPTSDDVNFYQAISFVPMNNLEYLERKANEIIHR